MCVCVCAHHSGTVSLEVGPGLFSWMLLVSISLIQHLNCNSALISSYPLSQHATPLLLSNSKPRFRIQNPLISSLLSPRQAHPLYPSFSASSLDSPSHFVLLSILFFYLFFIHTHTLHHPSSPLQTLLSFILLIISFSRPSIPLSPFLYRSISHVIHILLAALSFST